MKDFSHVFQALKNNNFKGKILINEPMSKHTSFKTGGAADLFVSPCGEGELKMLIRLLYSENIPMFVVGNGSNLLVSDEGFRGAIIHMGKGFSDINAEALTIRAGAGCLMGEVAQKALENSLAGFEFASGIPGTFGGGIFMNAGAYDGEIKDCLTSVKVLDKKTLDILEIPASELDLGYRKSSVEEKGYILLEGTISLEKGDFTEIKEKMNRLNAQRREKQPLSFPSAGSTFKRPEGYFAGKLIEDAGLKGFSVGGAEVSEKHAGFVINRGGASSNDILDVITHCQSVVFEKFGVKLEREVRILGEMQK